MRLLASILLLLASAPGADFNGTTSYATHSSVAYGTTDTWIAWIKLDGPGEDAARIIQGSDLYRSMIHVASSSSIQVNYNNAGTCTATCSGWGGSSIYGAWYMLAMTRAAADGGPRIWRGSASSAVVECSSYSTRSEGSGAGSGTTQFYFGNAATNDKTLDGQLAEIRRYDVPLSQAQLDQIRRGFEPLRGNLIYYWRLTGDPVDASDPIGGKTLTLSNVAVGPHAPIARPWGWWAFLQWWRWAR